MPNTVRVHNSVSGCIIDVHLNGGTSGNSSTAKAHASGEVSWDLEKMGWPTDQEVTVSVHAEGGVTRHAKFAYQCPQDYAFKANGTVDSFQVNGPN